MRQPRGTIERGKGTTDEDIGRPGPWKEGRYQPAGQPIDTSVLTPPGEAPDPDKPESTPVTRRDYVFPGEAVEGSGNTEPPGGDAG